MQTSNFSSVVFFLPLSPLLLLLLPSLAVSQGPVPTLPTKFISNYFSPSKSTHGIFALSEISELIYFENGTKDHLCSTYYNDTSCVQLTTKGIRYLWFNQLHKCCKCCRYDLGEYLCGGPLNGKFLGNETGNLVYMGIEDVFGVKCHKWNSIGLNGDYNYYYQFLDKYDDVPQKFGYEGLPCEIRGQNYLYDPSQPADDQYIFDPGSIKLSFNENQMFSVPDECKEAEFCKGRVCDANPPNLIFRKFLK